MGEGCKIGVVVEKVSGSACKSGESQGKECQSKEPKIYIADPTSHKDFVETLFSAVRK